MNKKITVLMFLLIFVLNTKSVFAQTDENIVFVPLIGITSVPEPLVLPSGGGSVTYKYAVKNFLREAPLTDVQINDDNCSAIRFVEGDDNNDGTLDYDETWRYDCTTELSQTSQSTATVTGNSGDLVATHQAHSTVIVGSDTFPPLVSVINVTKVARPLSLPAEGGSVTFTYKVNNPGVVPLSGVIVTDDKCHTVSSRLGDTNVNNLLDIDEVWIYTCTAMLNQTTTNTVSVTAYANGLKAIGNATITVEVDSPGFPEVGPVPSFPDLNIPGSSETETNMSFKIIVWGILGGILSGLITFFFLHRKKTGQAKQ